MTNTQLAVGYGISFACGVIATLKLVLWRLSNIMKRNPQGDIFDTGIEG